MAERFGYREGDFPITEDLGRRGLPFSWAAAALVLALFGAAVLSKEHTAVLPAVFLLSDYYWNPGFTFAGIRKNWRLYLPLAAAGLAGLAFIRQVLLSPNTAGFRVPGVTWSDYLLTQGRVIWTYIRLYLLPIGQNIDPDIALSRRPLDGGAIFGLVGVVAVLTGEMLQGIQIHNVALVVVWIAVSGSGLYLLMLVLQTSVHNQRAAAVLANIVVMTLMMLGGSFFPFELMPGFLARVGRLTPNGWAVEVVPVAGAMAGNLLRAGLLFHDAAYVQLE